MCEDMAAPETDDNKKRFFRKPNSFLWTGTSLVIIYAVWCVLLLILAASGNLFNSFECEDSNEEAKLVYIWSGLGLPVCILLLVEFWRKKGYWFKLFLGSTCVLCVIMCVTFYFAVENETQVLEDFESKYLSLPPLRDSPGNTQIQTCNRLNNVYHWQVEFKCCGLQGYWDWESSIPDSCLCGGKDNSSGCVQVGERFVHEKPCLPTVVSLVQKRRTTFWAVMIVWIIITAAPITIWPVIFLMGLAFCCYWMIQDMCCFDLSVWIYKMRGGEEMVPVVFIRQGNNNQTEEENVKDGEAKESGREDGVVVDIEGGTNAAGKGQEAEIEDWDGSAMTFIPLSELKKLQEELTPPPVQHQTECLCLMSRRRRNFYTILIDEGSPLLPSGAVLVDANKPTRSCVWAEGPHVFSVSDIIWPTERDPAFTQPL